MSEQSPVAQAFVAWAHAEAAAHYAAGCPDETMNYLTDAISNRLDKLFDTPAISAEDALLKCFTMLLYQFEPKLGDAPLTPKIDQLDGHVADVGLPRLLADMRRLIPAIAYALDVPHHKARKQG